MSPLFNISALVADNDFYNNNDINGDNVKYYNDNYDANYDAKSQNDNVEDAYEDNDFTHKNWNGYNVGFKEISQFYAYILKLKKEVARLYMWFAAICWN